MASPYVEFPDAVELTISHLRPRLSVPVYSRVPAEDVPATFVRVKRLGGLKATIITDRPRIDVACYAATEEDAESLMRVARAHMGAIAGAHGDTTVYRVAEVSGPMWIPDSASGQPCYAFSMEFSTRALPIT